MSEKPQNKKNRLSLILALLSAASAIVILLFYVDLPVFRKSASSYAPLSESNAQVAALKEYVLSDEVSSRIEEEIRARTGKNNFYAVFLSLCNVRDRARVVCATGETLESAWNNADKEAARLADSLNMNVAWAKADVVNYYKEIPMSAFNGDYIGSTRQNYLRVGVSLDRDFANAFLEAELSGNYMIDYYSSEELSARPDLSASRMNLDRVNGYLDAYPERNRISSIPERITIFTTRGFFCGEDGAVHELYGEGIEYGRRTSVMASKDDIDEIITAAADYLGNMVKEDGSFVYGYYPAIGKEAPGYNILRHAGSIWSLVCTYRLTGDDSAIPKIDSALAYLESCIEYKDGNTAYVVERVTGEVKLGGNAIAVLALAEYAEVFGTDKHKELAGKLANGIIALQNPDTGGYYHVLEFPGFARKEEFRTVFYDGEATFALAKAYSLTGDQKYLDAAAAAVDFFIENDYVQHRDHWVSYALNEVTKHIEEPRYYDFALRNAAENLSRIRNQRSLDHTTLELLMAAWETFERAVELNISSLYLLEFDAEALSEVIFLRAENMLNGYFFPEYAMYMKNPEQILGSFYIRNDGFRVRIDDIQHVITGLYFYSEHYDRVRSHLPAELFEFVPPSSSSESAGQDYN